MLSKYVRQGQDQDIDVTIKLKYKLAYSLSREGLNSYVDQGTNYQYIFSQLIFHCWAVFPCFDQPDLKADFLLKVLTHDDWAVATNGTEKAIHHFDANQEIGV